MGAIKIEKLTLKETSRVLGGEEKIGSPGGTAGCSGEETCECCCSCGIFLGQLPKAGQKADFFDV